MEESSDAQARPDQNEEASTIGADEGISSRRRLFQLAATHLGAVTLVLCLWAGADSWLTLTGLGLAGFLSIITGLIAGLVVTFAFHEWSHLAGTVLAGGRYTLPERPAVFVFDFDYENNSTRQFTFMTLGGQVGSLLGVLFLWTTIPADNIGRALMLSFTVGLALFAAVIEIPSLIQTRKTGDVANALAAITKTLLIRAAQVGVVATLVIWFLLA